MNLSTVVILFYGSRQFYFRSTFRRLYLDAFMTLLVNEENFNIHITFHSGLVLPSKFSTLSPQNVDVITWKASLFMNIASEVVMHVISLTVLCMVKWRDSGW